MLLNFEFIAKKSFGIFLLNDWVPSTPLWSHQWPEKVKDYSNVEQFGKKKIFWVEEVSQPTTSLIRPVTHVYIT